MEHLSSHHNPENHEAQGSAFSWSENETKEKAESKEIDALYESLDGQVLKNSEGQDVTLQVERTKETKSNEEMWHIFFAYEYRGKAINYKNKNMGSYIQLSLYPDSHSIKIDFAQLEGVVLKGKNIYPQVIDLLSKNFPTNYKLEAEFGHEKTKQAILEAKSEYEKGAINKEELKQKIATSYLFKNRIASGFNKFDVEFKPNSKGEFYIKVVSSKTGGSTQPEINISGLTQEIEQ